MGLFGRLFRRKVNWDDIDSSASIYPDASISLFTVSSETGETFTGWVDKGYVDYEFKAYCPYNFLIKVDLNDHIASANGDLDMASVEDYFLAELRQIGVSHMVARIATAEGMNIEFYHENYKQTKARLGELMTDDGRLVSFTCEINDDTKWRAVHGLMALE